MWSLSSTSAIPSPLIAFLTVCYPLRAPRAHLFSTPSTRAASVGFALFDFPTLNFYLP
ncbi:hypothetical protein EV122DRAFT_271240 [Schizophyllum commune]